MGTANFALLNSPSDNLSRYLQATRSFPMLTIEEEQRLAHRWRDHDDLSAAHEIVNSHLRLAAKIAYGFRGYGLPVGELISEGNIGLMQAVKRFDPNRGFRFSTYAMWWIKAAIQEYILHSWSLVKMGTTSAQKKLFFNLRKIKSQMQAIDEGDMSDDQVKIVASRLDVPIDEVVNMNRRMSGQDSSLNTVIHHEGKEEWQDWLQDNRDDQETTLANDQENKASHILLMNAMKGLNERERKILSERRLKESPSTLENLSIVFGISRERVRQIEVRAFEKVQKQVRNTLIEQRIAC